MSDALSTLNEYPEHAKAEAAEEKSLLLSEFLDWLEQNKFVLAVWEERRNGVLSPSYATKESLIARFIGVDLKAFYAEKQAMHERLVEWHKAQRGESAV